MAMDTVTAAAQGQPATQGPRLYRSEHQ